MREALLTSVIQVCRSSSSRSASYRSFRTRAVPLQLNGAHPPRDQDPANLGRRKIRIDQKARPLLDERFVARLLQFVAKAAVCTRSCHTARISAIDRPPGLTVPHHRRLTLVGDTDRRNVARPNAPRLNASTATLICEAQISSGSCSTHPGLRKDLFELALRNRPDRSLMIEQNRPRTGRALVQR